MPGSFPPLEAYRRDLARLGTKRTFGPDDGQWVAAAMLLERLADGTSEGRETVAAELARYLAVEDDTSFPAAGLRVAAQIERAGALNLAATWLALLERSLIEREARDVGRVKALRASVLRKLGATEKARQLYAEVEALGRASAEPELTARAWIGYAVLAQMRGNYPESRRWYQAAALVADDNGFPEQTFIARQGLMIAAAKARDFDRAMREGWNAFVASGSDRDREAEVLTNMAQALHDSGRHDAALRGFAAAVVRTERPDILLAALGGAATAAAVRGRRDTVEAAAERIMSLGSTVWDYPRASALLDLADAYATLEDVQAENDYRSRALEIALANGFHELTLRASSPAPEPSSPSQPSPFGFDATRVVCDLETLDADVNLIRIE